MDLKAYLPDHTLIREEFGMHANQSKQFPMAQMMVCYDVLNHICFESRIDDSACDEISIAIDWVNHLPNDSLTIYDRGYASFTLIYLLTYYQRDFVIRCKIGFNQVIRDFVKSRRPSALVNFPATNRGKKTLETVRLVSRSTYQRSG